MADKNLSVLLNAKETITKALAKVSKSFGSTERSGNSLARSLQTITAASQPAQDSLDDMGDKANSAGRGISRASRAMAKATPSAVMYAGAVDEVGDEALEAAAKNTTLAAAVNSADLSFGNMTVNIGAIGVALKNLHTQIPILVTVLGTLIGSLYGVAAAATAAAGAIGLIFGGGALALGQEYADTMEDVENAMEGIAEVMKTVGSMFQEAMEPLMDQTSIDYFIEGMEGVANTFGRVVGWVRSMREEFMDFGRTIGSIFNDELPRVLGAFENAFMELRPILEDVMRFFMGGLADSINYFTDMIIQIEDELRQFVNTLLDFLRAIHELGVVTMIQGALPIFMALIDGLTELIDMINSMNDELVSGIGKIMGMVLALKLLSGAVGGLFGPLAAVGSALSNAFIGAGAVGGIRNLGKEVLALTGSVFPGFVTAADSVKGAISMVGSSFVDAKSSLSVFGDTWYSLRSSLLTTSRYDPAENIAALGMASSGAADGAKDLQRAISGVSFGSFADEAVEGARAAGGLRGAIVGLFDDFSKLMFDARDLGFAGAFQEAFNNVEIPNRITSKLNNIYESTTLAASGFRDMFTAGASGQMLGVLDEATGRVRDAKGQFMSMENIFPLDTQPTGFEMIGYHLGRLKATAVDVGGTLFDAFRTPIASAESLAGTITGALIPAKVSDTYATFTQTYANSGLAAALTGVVSSAWAGARALPSLAASKLSDAAASLYATATNAGYRAALMGLLAPLGGVIAGLWSKASAALAAAGAVAAQAAATAIAVGPMGALAMAAGAVNVALGGLPMIIGALVLGIGALVGIIGNAKGEFGGISGIIEVVKAALAGLGDLILRAFIPVWNAMVSAFMIIWKPIDAVVSGLLSVGHALGIVSEDTNDTASLMKALFALLGPIADAFGAVFKVIDMILRPIGTLLALPIKAFFWTLATAIKVVLFPFRALIAIIRFFLNVLWETITLIPGMETALTGLADGIKFLLGAIVNFGETWDAIWDGIVDAVVSAMELVTPMINDLIEMLNRLPGVDIDPVEAGDVRAKVAEAREEEGGNSLRVAREDFAKESEEEDQENIAKAPNPNISFEEHREQNINGDMNMLPEEKERVKKLVQDAMDEANTYRRKRQGHSG